MGLTWNGPIRRALSGTVLRAKKHELNFTKALDWELRSSRDQAQAIMEAQADQIDRLQKQLLELKKLVSAAKAACRKKGRCFDVAKGPKPKRSPGEKVRREIARVPGNLRRLFRLTPAIDADKKLAPPSLKERYAKWIAQQIEAQRTESENWDVRPTISLLIPVFDTSQ